MREIIRNISKFRGTCVVVMFMMTGMLAAMPVRAESADETPNATVYRVILVNGEEQTEIGSTTVPHEYVPPDVQLTSEIKLCFEKSHDVFVDVKALETILSLVQNGGASTASFKWFLNPQLKGIEIAGGVFYVNINMHLYLYVNRVYTMTDAYGNAHTFTPPTETVDLGSALLYAQLIPGSPVPIPYKCVYRWTPPVFEGGTTEGTITGALVGYISGEPDLPVPLAFDSMPFAYTDTSANIGLLANLLSNMRTEK